MKDFIKFAKKCRKVGRLFLFFCSKERLLVIFGIFLFLLNYKLW